MTQDNIIHGWFRESPDSPTTFLRADDLDPVAGFDEGYVAPPGAEPRAAGKENPTPREIGFDRGLELGLRHTAYANGRHPSAQVRGRK